MTVLYYLNDVTRGGETAFPVADEEDFNRTVMFVWSFFKKEFSLPWSTVSCCPLSVMV